MKSQTKTMILRGFVGLYLMQLGLILFQSRPLRKTTLPTSTGEPMILRVSEGADTPFSFFPLLGLVAIFDVQPGILEVRYKGENQEIYFDIPADVNFEEITIAEGETVKVSHPGNGSVEFKR